MLITLNISGKIFKVPYDIIRKAQLFDNMLNDCEIINEVVIDRSAKLFKHVLSYLIDDKYPYPRKYYSELDYYLVPYDIDLLYDPHKKMELEIAQLKKNQILMMHEIIELELPEMVQTFKECAKYGCYNNCENHYQLCNDHKEHCCYRTDDGKFCDKNIPYYRGYCDEHVFSYLE
uniref:Potassium channel tetramerisation-type BTB domain-containing protein n=1 Tax=viral metagenome TaxID=1070528 RepID=A0A6C0C724_9ZZZZ